MPPVKQEASPTPKSQRPRTAQTPPVAGQGTPGRAMAATGSRTIAAGVKKEPACASPVGTAAAWQQQKQNQENCDMNRQSAMAPPARGTTAAAATKPCLAPAPGVRVATTAAAATTTTPIKAEAGTPTPKAREAGGAQQQDFGAQMVLLAKSHLEQQRQLEKRHEDARAQQEAQIEQMRKDLEDSQHREKEQQNQEQHAQYAALMRKEQEAFKNRPSPPESPRPTQPPFPAVGGLKREAAQDPQRAPCGTFGSSSSPEPQSRAARGVPETTGGGGLPATKSEQGYGGHVRTKQEPSGLEQRSVPYPPTKVVPGPRRW